MNKILLASLLSVAALQTAHAGIARSCAVLGQDQVNVGISLERQDIFPFHLQAKKGEKLDDKTSIGVMDCAKAAGKFLMIGFGPNEYALDSKSYSTVYSEDLSPAQCWVADSPLKDMPFEERNEVFKSRRNFINKCLVTTVHHKGSQPLSALYRPKQVGCTVTPIDMNTASFEGGFCFFRIMKDSKFTIEHHVRPECLDENYLAENNVQPGEYNLSTTFAVAGNPTGTSNDLELLPSKRIQFLLEAPTHLMSASTDVPMTTPYYADVLEAPSTEFGKINIRPMTNGMNVQFPLLVDNRCKKACSHGVCTSRCNFSQPVVGEVALYKIVNGRRQELSTWYDGAVALPNWLGFLDLKGNNVSCEPPRSGERYEIVMKFTDPATDYMMFLKALDPKIKVIPGIPTQNFAQAMMSGLPTISGMPNVSTVGSIEPIGDVANGFQISNEGVGTISDIGGAIWPPYYERVCKNGKCVGPSNRSYNVQSISFTLGAKDYRGFELKDIKTSQKSKLEKGYARNIYTLPNIRCTWDE